MEEASLAWLFSLADQERGVGWNPRASPDSQWKLGRTRALLDLAGAPDRRLRVVLVAGTKGKGSTCAMLASILGAAGIRCGLYTKPHLQSYRERVRIDGQALAPRAFDDAIERMRGYAADLPEAAGEPTTFEVTTALALDEFARQACEMAVVEVGLGGRLDATNALEPAVSVITSISYDHTAILGRTLGAIAAEKAGILRHCRPGILAQQRPAAMRALRQACRAIGAACEVVTPLDQRQYPLALAGAHQLQNAALAVAGAGAMASVDDEAIALGLTRVRWAGRFEIVDRTPAVALAGPHNVDHGSVVVLDGAHNGASAEALVRTLGAYAAGRPVALVVGINRDKDARAVLRPPLGLTRTIWATQSADNPRALPADELGRLCRGLGADVHVEPHLPAALAAAGAWSVEAAGVVCVTGSLALVGQARTVLGLAVPERLW